MTIEMSMRFPIIVQQGIVPNKKIPATFSTTTHFIQTDQQPSPDQRFPNKFPKSIRPCFHRATTSGRPIIPCVAYRGSRAQAVMTTGSKEAVKKQLKKLITKSSKGQHACFPCKFCLYKKVSRLFPAAAADHGHPTCRSCHSSQPILSSSELLPFFLSPY